MSCLVRSRSRSAWLGFLSFRVFTPPEETEHGTRPGGRGPGGVPGGVGSKNRGGGHVRLYRGGSIPYSHFVCLFVCLCVVF